MKIFYYIHKYVKIIEILLSVVSISSITRINFMEKYLNSVLNTFVIRWYTIPVWLTGNVYE